MRILALSLHSGIRYGRVCEVDLVPLVWTRHQGFFSPEYLPLSRGFNFTNGFLCGGEDHFEQWGILGVTCSGQQPDTPRDIWQEDKPAPQLAGQYTGTRFAEVSTYLYSERLLGFRLRLLRLSQTAVSLIQNHSARFGDAPLFLYLALHNTHGPVRTCNHFPTRIASTFPPLPGSFKPCPASSTSTQT